MTEHLGYDRHDPAGREKGSNSRNGTRSKTVLTDVGPVEVEVPRDRDGSFEPKIVKKRQRRLSGVDEMVISLFARGLTTGEVSAHMAEVYGTAVSKDTISRITEKVLAEMAEWQNRPLDQVYPVVFIDALVVKIRDGQVTNRPVYTAIGVTVDGERDILPPVSAHGLTAQRLQHGDRCVRESADQAGGAVTQSDRRHQSAQRRLLAHVNAF